ncbi:hypothetical protein B0A52_09042 [Exophiala mesophila]|uniref:Mg2+ transporter protein, CorA-like/Zinc transport protein ZntB n=1 Tax=Exophiala mesophila TaxID=212818 RepID=A0A438MTC7_EXOME|nr:hypothetical protein B0A52_09042 [Exophiala mesophila]
MSSSRDVVIEIDQGDNSPPSDPVSATKLDTVVEVTSTPTVDDTEEIPCVWKLIEIGENEHGEWEHNETSVPEEKVLNIVEAALSDLENGTTPKRRTFCAISIDPFRKEASDSLGDDIVKCFGGSWADTSNRLTLFHRLPPRLQREGDTLKINQTNVYRIGSLAADIHMACSDHSPATFAYIWSCVEADRWIYETAPDLLNDIKSHQSMARHPMLLLQLACKQMIEEALAILRVAFNDVDQAALVTEFRHRRHDTTGRDLSEIDLSEFSAEVSGMAINIAQFGNSLDELLELANCIISECTRLDTLVDVDAETTVKGQMSWTASNNFVRQNAVCLVRKAKSARSESNAWQHTASIMVQGLFNLIAQRDQNQNIRIANDTQILARESKRDSTAMKAIAFVTMIFLPGTFLSSVFSMNLFEWDAPNSSDVVNHRMWVYWAVAVPLTIMVVVFYLLWEKYMMKLYQKSVQPEDDKKRSSGEREDENGNENEKEDEGDEIENGDNRSENDKASIKTAKSQPKSVDPVHTDKDRAEINTIRGNDSLTALTMTRRGTNLSTWSQYSKLGKQRTRTE